MRYAIGLIAAGGLAACAGAPESAGNAPRIHSSDLAMLEGSWTGALTYRDYSEPYEDVTIPATLEVARREAGIELRLNYPDEPSAYGVSMLEPSADGRRLNSEDVVDRNDRGDDLVIVTRSDCEDDGRPARCEMTYTLSPQVFRMTKMVRLEAGGEAFRRNTYAFERAR